jgi:hypothetical protein
LSGKNLKERQNIMQKWKKKTIKNVVTGVIIKMRSTRKWQKQ